MNRKLWPWLTLAFLSIVAALVVGLFSTRETRGGEAFAHHDPKSVRKIILKSPQKLIEFEPISLSAAWITVKDQGRSEQLLAGQRTRDIWFSLSPIWATRVLGKWNKKKAVEYGFQSPDTLFRIEEIDGRGHEYRVGGRGFHSTDYFVYHAERNKIFLWNRETIDLLRDPARAAMKKLDIFEPEAINAILIKDENDKSKSLELMKNARLWTANGQALQADAPILEWLKGLSKITIQGYRKPSADAGKAILRMALDVGSRLDIKLLYDPANKLYVLHFGPDKAEIILAASEFEPLWVEWNEGKIHGKN